MSENLSGASIHVAMSRVMSDITAIEKNQRNNHFNFNFRGIDDVMNALHGPLTKHGVFYVPEVLEHEIIRGDKQRHATLKVRYTFYGPLGDSVSASVTAEGLDSSDKAATKAMSTALKYALLQVFCIPTEEQREIDPDRSGEQWSTGEARPSQPPTETGREVSPVSSKAQRSGTPPGSSTRPSAASRDETSIPAPSSAVAAPSSSEGVDADASELSRVWGSARGDERATAEASSEALLTIETAIAEGKVTEGKVNTAAVRAAAKVQFYPEDGIASIGWRGCPVEVHDEIIRILDLNQGALT